MKYGMWKGVFWILVYGFIFVNVFFANVVLHEFGHYLAADYYDLRPKIEFNFSEIGNLSFGLDGVALASIRFDLSDNRTDMIVVSLMGPFLNFVFGVIFLIVFVFCENIRIREIVFMGFVISIGSFLVNMMPMEGVDGGLVFESVINLIND